MSAQKAYLDNLHQELDFYKKQLSVIKEQFKENTKDDRDNIVQSLQHLVSEAQSAYSQLKSASKDEWEPLKKHSAEAFSKLRVSWDNFLNESSEQAAVYAQRFRKYSEERLEDLGEYIKDNPFKSVLIAAATGFIIAKLFK